MSFILEGIDKKLDDLLGVAVGAGDIIMNYFHSGFKVSYKSDKSPVTEADIAADKFISEKLQKITPDIFNVSEEGYELNPSAYKNPPDVFWCVDPLDGTKNFINKENTFTVNIGLIVNKKAVFGILYVPFEDRLYFSTGEGSYKIHKNKKTLMKPASLMNEINIVTSARTPDEKLSDLMLNVKTGEMRCEYKKIATSEKFCLVADSKFNIFPCFARSKEWDTAAGQAIVDASGGKVFISGGHELRYGKNDFENPHFIAVSNPKKIQQKLLSSILQTLD